MRAAFVIFIGICAAVAITASSALEWLRLHVVYRGDILKRNRDEAREFVERR